MQKSIALLGNASIPLIYILEVNNALLALNSLVLFKPSGRDVIKETRQQTFTRGHPIIQIFSAISIQNLFLHNLHTLTNLHVI